MFIREWYLKEYPTDELGATLNADKSFDELCDALEYGFPDGEDVYDFLGGDADSVIRERVFEKLANLMGCNYDVVYERWLYIERN